MILTARTGHGSYLSLKIDAFLHVGMLAAPLACGQRLPDMTPKFAAS